MTFQSKDDRTKVRWIDLVGLSSAGPIRSSENDRIARSAASVSQARLKVSVEHSLCRKGRSRRICGALNRVLPAEKKEQLIFSDRPADCAAELVALEIIERRRSKGGGGCGGRGQHGIVGRRRGGKGCVPRVENIVAQILEGVTVKYVGAGFGDHVDGAGRVRAVFRGQGTCFHFKFFDGIGERERKILIAQRIVVRAAVEPVGHTALRAAGDRRNGRGRIGSTKCAALT